MEAITRNVQIMLLLIGATLTGIACLITHHPAVTADPNYKPPPQAVDITSTVKTQTR